MTTLALIAQYSLALVQIIAGFIGGWVITSWLFDRLRWFAFLPLILFILLVIANDLAGSF